MMDSAVWPPQQWLLFQESLQVFQNSIAAEKSNGGHRYHQGVAKEKILYGDSICAGAVRSRVPATSF